MEFLGSSSMFGFLSGGLNSANEVPQAMAVQASGPSVANSNWLSSLADSASQMVTNLADYSISKGVVASPEALKAYYENMVAQLKTSHSLEVADLNTTISELHSTVARKDAKIADLYRTMSTKVEESVAVVEERHTDHNVIVQARADFCKKAMHRTLRGGQRLLASNFDLKRQLLVHTDAVEDALYHAGLPCHSYSIPNHLSSTTCYSSPYSYTHVKRLQSQDGSRCMNSSSSMSSGSCSSSCGGSSNSSGSDSSGSVGVAGGDSGGVSSSSGVGMVSDISTSGIVCTHPPSS